MKLQDRAYRKNSDPDVIEALDDMKTFWNAGRYQAPELSAAPTHTGSSGEFCFVDIGGTKYLYAWTGGAWKSVALS